MLIVTFNFKTIFEEIGRKILWIILHFFFRWGGFTAVNDSDCGINHIQPYTHDFISFIICLGDGMP